MSTILSPENRAVLLSSHKKERDKRVADRIKAVLLYDEGWTQVQIAKALFIHEETVREYLNKYKEDGNLAPNHKGSKPILNESESSLLTAHLESRIYVKVKDIQAHIRGTMGKEMAISTIHDWLRSNGFTYKKPKIIPRDIDSVKQEEFIRQYHKIMNEASISGDPVLFGDAVHPSEQTKAAYGWIKKGKDKAIESTGARRRVNLMGALNLETMKLIWQDFDTINAKSAVEFLRQIECAHSTAKVIHLIWDRASYHMAKDVQEYLVSSKIKVHYLPPRSPNLNPIERLWKIMHEHVSNNRTYMKFQDFKDNLFRFFNDTVPIIYDELVNRITDNFQVLKPV